MESRDLPPPYTTMDKKEMSSLASAPSGDNIGWNHNRFEQQQSFVNQAPISTPPVVTTHTVTVTTAAVPGSCPVCHSTRGFSTGFTCCGYLLCICCFPCGIICCLMCNRKKSCRHCNFTTT